MAKTVSTPKRSTKTPKAPKTPAIRFTRTEGTPVPPTDLPSEKVVDIPPAPVVPSVQLTSDTQQTSKGRPIMDITLTRKPDARKTLPVEIFTPGDGRRGSVQFPRSWFGDEVPEQLTVAGPFANYEDRKSETPKERRQRLAQESPEKKLQRIREQFARKEEKLRKEIAASGQPVEATL